MGTEQEVELQKHLERRLASLLEEFEHWYGRPVTMATLCTVAAARPRRPGHVEQRVLVCL